MYYTVISQLLRFRKTRLALWIAWAVVLFMLFIGWQMIFKADGFDFGAGRRSTRWVVNFNGVAWWPDKILAPPNKGLSKMLRAVLPLQKCVFSWAYGTKFVSLRMLSWALDRRNATIARLKREASSPTRCPIARAPAQHRKRLEPSRTNRRAQNALPLRRLLKKPPPGPSPKSPLAKLAAFELPVPATPFYESYCTTMGMASRVCSPT